MLHGTSHSSPSPHPPPHLFWKVRRRCAWISHLTLRALTGYNKRSDDGISRQVVVSYRIVSSNLLNNNEGKNKCVAKFNFVPVNCCICITTGWRYGGGSCIIAIPTLSPPNAPISKHSKHVYCNVVHVRGYPMSVDIYPSIHPMTSPIGAMESSPSPLFINPPFSLVLQIVSTRYGVALSNFTPIRRLKSEFNNNNNNSNTTK